MFLQQHYQAEKSSHFIMFTLGISVLLHALFVVFVKQENFLLQSGSASRISVAIHRTNNPAVNDTEIKEKNISQQAIPKVNSTHMLKPSQSPKVVESTQSTRPVEPKTKISIPRVAKLVVPITETQTKPELVKTELNVADIESKRGQDLPAKQALKTEEVIQNQSSLASADGGGQSQIKRYEIGSNNNPKPSYPSLAVKRGWQGQVVLGVHVNPDGTIKHLTFVKSTDYGVLNFEAFETVRTSWHFTPLEDESELSQSSYIEVPITFNIANR